MGWYLLVRLGPCHAECRGATHVTCTDRICCTYGERGARVCREKNKKKKYKIYGRRTHKNRTEHRKNYMGEFEFYKNKKGLRLSLLFSTVADMYGAGVRGGGGGARGEH